MISALILSSVFPLFSDDTVRIDDTFREIDISNQIYLFEDSSKNRNLKIEDLKEENFRQYKESRLPPSFGYKDADYWVRFRIDFVEFLRS